MRKKVITILTCIVMAMAFMPVSAFAAESTGTAPFHYVALGDASTAGFGMAETGGYGILTEGTYPDLIGKALKAKGFDPQIDQLAMSGMRVEELRYLLDDGYAGDSYLRDSFPGLAELRADYRSSIADANLITYGLGAVNVGSYFLYLAGDIDNRCDDQVISNLAEADADGIRPALEAEVNSIVNDIPSAVKTGASAKGYDIEQLVKDYSGAYIRAAAYAYYSFCYNYDQTIALIKAQNPEADIVVLGVDNMLENLSVTLKVKVLVSGKELPVEVTTLDIGTLYENNLINKVNNHMKNAQGIYRFIETRDMTRFLDEIRAYDGQPSKEFKLYCNKLEDDLLLSDAVNASLKKYSSAKRAKGQTAAYNTVATCLKNVAGITSVTLTLSTDQLNPEAFKQYSNLGKELMANLKAKSLEFAKLAAEGSVYTSKLNSFSTGALYGEDVDSRDMGKIFMAIGIHSQMGEGFFQHPSAKGHKQIKDAVLNAYGGKVMRVLPRDASCTVNGNIEYWKNVATGSCFSDEACTQPMTAAEYSIKALGHHYGAWVKAADGTKAKVCDRCGAKEICPAGTVIVKKTGAKKAFTVKWKKNTKYTTGYQVRYSLKKSMAKAKTVTIKSNKTVSKTVKKLKAKKTYYVQVRTYKKSGDNTYYSDWSGKKAVKTK